MAVFRCVVPEISLYFRSGSVMEAKTDALKKLHNVLDSQINNLSISACSEDQIIEYLKKVDFTVEDE